MCIHESCVYGFTCFWICIYMKQWFTCWICLDVIQLSMMFSVLIRIPLCDCYFMSPRVLIDWWLQDAILEFIWVNMFTSLSLIAIYLICFVYIIFLWIFFFDKHFPLDIYMGSHVIFIDGIVDSSFHNKRLHVCTFFKEREKKSFPKSISKMFLREALIQKVTWYFPKVFAPKPF